MQHMEWDNQGFNYHHQLWQGSIEITGRYIDILSLT
jgi:hypothetical protein